MVILRYRGRVNLLWSVVCRRWSEQKEYFPMSIVIRGGTVVTASDIYQADVLIEGEKITTIGHGLSKPIP